MVSGPMERGRHERVWDGRDEVGRRAATGVYFARLSVDGRTSEQKVMLVH
jgi:hypothetical protein